MPHVTDEVEAAFLSMSSMDTKDLLPHTPGNGIHDLLGIGFGPAALAIAVAIYDILERRATEGSTALAPRLKFLERQAGFGWHSGMLLPGTKMQISFVKDLATMRNPGSHFTFLNYLKEQNRLVQFSNLDTFLPLRIEFEDYLKWSANHFQDIVHYSEDVISVEPTKFGTTTKYNCLQVTSRNTVTEEISIQYGKNVVIAVGGRPSVPQVFTGQDERVIHSSRYNTTVGNVLPDKNADYTIAVVGAGQSAAEVFNDLHTRYPNAKSILLMRDTAMRPSDDSPFVNEVFNPEVIDEFYSTAAEARNAQLKVNKATNYSVVRLPLLEQIYEGMYHQRMQDPNPENWQNRILPSREVVGISSKPHSKHLELEVKTLSTVDPQNTLQTLSVDAVILATGYIRDVHNEMLKGCQSINAMGDGSWLPGRDYKLKLDRNAVEDDVQIYLQGCNEKTHGLSDTLLSVLSTRGGEIVESIFGSAIVEADIRDLVQRSTSDSNGPLGPLWRLHKTSTVQTFSDKKHLSPVQMSTMSKL